MSKLYLTASGGSASIHGYLFNNIARGVMQSLSPLARRLRGKNRSETLLLIEIYPRPPYKVYANS